MLSVFKRDDHFRFRSRLGTTSVRVEAVKDPSTFRIVKKARNCLFRVLIGE